MAVAATTALALSGLAFAPSSADTIDDFVTPPNAELYSPNSTFGPGTVSTKVDGNGNTTARLVAGAPATVAGFTVNGVRFTIPEIGVNTIVPVNQGLAILEVTIPGNVGPVTVGAQPVLSGGGGPAPTTTTVIQTDGLDQPNLQQAISIDGATRSRKGYFYNPDDATYPSGTGNDEALVAITGDSGNDVVNVTVGALIADNDGAYASATGASAAIQTSPVDSNGLRGYSSVVDAIDAVTPLVNGDDDLVIYAQNGDSDEAQVFTSYQQVITPGTATLAVAAGSTSNVAGDSDGPGPEPANDNRSFYTITIKDTEGQPVAGVDVFESDAGGNHLDGNARFVDQTTNAVVDLEHQRTTGTGTLRVDLQESTMDNGLDQDAGDPNHQSAYFVVDANGDGDYDAGTDTLLRADQTNIPAAPASVTIESSMGLNLDDDETTDVTITVKDADGQPVVGTNVQLLAALDDKTDPAESQGLTDPGLVLPATDHNGQIKVLGLSPTAWFGPDYENDWVLMTAQVTAGTVTSSIELQFDTSSLNWEKESVQALKGSRIEVQGDLTLDNSGAPLPNRLVGHQYFPSVDADGPGPSNIAGNSGYDATQPADTVSGTPITATSTTAADGSFRVAISDPASPDGEELNSKALVSAVSLSQAEGVVNYGAPDGNPIGFRVAVSDLLDVDFLRSLAVADLRIINDDTGTQADGLLNPIDGNGVLTPGATGLGHVEARNPDGVLLVDANVDLTIEEGHFVTGLEATPVPDAPLDFNNAGKSITVNTGEFDGAFVANIERHVGFDDDGRVDDNMTATSGAASDVHDLTWTTADGVPLNQDQGDITVGFSDPNESTILPEARAGNAFGGVGQIVDFDVETVDQFGNRTSQPLTVDDKANPLGFVFDNDGPQGASSEFDLTQPAYWTNAYVPTDQTTEVELVGARTTVYKDNAATSEFDPTNPLALVDVQPADIERDAPTVNWYAIDFDASTFDLGQLGPDSVPVGSAVTEVLTAVDQKGQPIQELEVDFLRGGPGSFDDDGCHDDNEENCVFTDFNGEAFYDFVGGSEGTATVTAVIFDDNHNRVRTVGPDTVQFVGVTVPVDINVKLRGKSINNGKRDMIRVNAPKVAKGAKVILQKKVKGQWKKVGKTKRLNKQGDRAFSIKDRNGNRVTKYRAKVRKNANVNAATSRVLRQR